MSLRDLIRSKKREQLHRDGFESADPSIEELEAEQREVERLDRYVTDLRRERMDAQVHLARWRAMRPDARVWDAWESPVGEPPTAAWRAAQCEQRIAAITAELRRVAGDARGLE